MGTLDRVPRGKFGSCVLATLDLAYSPKHMTKAALSKKATDYLELGGPVQPKVGGCHHLNHCLDY